MIAEYKKTCMGQNWAFLRMRYRRAERKDEKRKGERKKRGEGRVRLKRRARWRERRREWRESEA